MPSRRAILVGLGLVATAGCMGPEAGSGPSGDAAAGGGGSAPNASSNGSDGGRDAAGNDAVGDDEAESDGSADQPADEPGDEPEYQEPRGPVRGAHDATPSVEVVEQDEEGENTTLTDDGAVRYVAGWRHTNHEEVEAGEPPEREPFYETTEWERWAEIQTRHAAAREAAEHAAAELGVEEGISSGSSSRVVDDGSVAVVSTTTTLDREGEVVGEPPVAFEDLVAATPRSVEATYVLEDREYTTTQPIYVRHSVAQYQ